VKWISNKSQKYVSEFINRFQNRKILFDRMQLFKNFTKPLEYLKSEEYDETKVQELKNKNLKNWDELNFKNSFASIINIGAEFRLKFEYDEEKLKSTKMNSICKYGNKNFLFY